MKEKLDKRTKWTYCIGAVGRDAAYALISMFLLTYIQYTIGLSAAQYAAVTAIVTVCLVWDAINDPMMGIIIENRNMKSGKYRPWILLGAILNSVVIVLLFTVRLTGWNFVIFFGFCYLSWGMTFTMNDISYWGMLPSLSSDPKERNTLVTLMSIFVCIGQFSVAGIIPILAAGNAVGTYRWAAIVIAFAFLAFQLLTFFGVKERKRTEVREKVTLKKMFKIFLRNDQLVAIGIAFLLYNIGSGLLISFGMNFFYFEFGYGEGGGLITIFTVMYGLGTLLSQFLFPILTKRFSRKKLMTFMAVMIFIGYGLFLAFGYILPRNVVLLDAIGLLIFLCQGFTNMLLIVMLNNTIEYDEWRTGERHDSIVSAVRSFSVKLASAINQGIIALVLILSGIYGISGNVSALEVSKGLGEITSEEVLAQADEYISQATGSQLFALRLGMVVIPVVAILICNVITRKKYIIDEKKYDEIVAETAARKNV